MCRSYADPRYGFCSTGLPVGSHGASVRNETWRVDVLRCNCRLQRICAADDLDCLLHPGGIQDAKGLSREGADDLGLRRGDVCIDLAEMLVHDCASLLRIGNGIRETLHCRGDKSPNKVRVRFDETVA